MDLLEQAFYMLKSFHKHCRNTELVVDKNFYTSETDRDFTDIIDPDKFIVQKTTQSLPKWSSIFDLEPNIKKKIEAELNFYVRVENSSLAHHDSHEGLFIYLNPDQDSSSSENNNFVTNKGVDKIQPGT